MMTSPRTHSHTHHANAEFMDPFFLLRRSVHPVYEAVLTYLLAAWALLAAYGPAIVVDAFWRKDNLADYRRLRLEGASREILKSSEGNLIDTLFFE